MLNNILEKLSNKWVIVLSALFIIINGVFIARENFYFMAVPVALLVIYLYFFHLDKLLLIITFLTPLSLTLEDKDFNIGVALPTEPLMFGIMLLFIFRCFTEGYPKKILKHPITIAIIISLCWMFITCLTSSEVVVSLKYFASRLWFTSSFFFLGILLFKEYKNIKRFIWLYMIPLAIVISYTLIRHTNYMMDQKAANWVMDPFYKDHTSYGAVIAMYFPLLIAIIIDKDGKNRFEKRFAIGFLFLFTLGLLFSYTRAAWVGLAGSIALMIFIVFKIKFRYVILLGLSGLAMFFTFQDQIIMSLEQNRQDSSDDLAKHVQSISNISSDASNLERLNRWSAAYRMFKQRPFFGWGPGTYQLKYAPFQLSTEKTIISTNSGDMGNAHSEYIGPLVESGVFGTLSFFGIIGTIIYSAIRVYNKNKTRQKRLYALTILLGLFTYMIHGFLNNFLDLDKASVPFWGFAAVIVSLELFNDDDEKEKESI